MLIKKYYKQLYIAYIVLDDNRKLRDFWVINSISDKPELKKYKYEFPGDKYVTQNELVIIDIVERTARKTKIQKWNDQYVMPFSVTSDSKYVFFERTKRTWDEVDVCSVNTSTLEVKELIHEVDKPYRDPHARSVEVLNDGKDILFRSERTGWGHYYHYDGQGNLKNAISSGPWIITHIAVTVTVICLSTHRSISPMAYSDYNKAKLRHTGTIAIIQRKVSRNEPEVWSRINNRNNRIFLFRIKIRRLPHHSIQIRNIIGSFHHKIFRLLPTGGIYLT